jgi:hypothetical protein
MTIVTSNTNIQYFSSSDTETHQFYRAASNIIITFSGTNNMSMDGYNYIPMTAGTFHFDHLGFIKNLSFTGTGTRSGFGIAQ